MYPQRYHPRSAPCFAKFKSSVRTGTVQDGVCRSKSSARNLYRQYGDDCNVFNCVAQWAWALFINRDTDSNTHKYTHMGFHLSGHDWSRTECRCTREPNHISLSITYMLALILIYVSAFVCFVLHVVDALGSSRADS